MDSSLPVLELQYLDSTGTKGTTTVKYPLGTTYAVIDASASAFASLIAPITGCVLIRQRIIFKATVTPRDVPDTGSLIHNAGVFVFSNGEDNPNTIVSVPGILDAVLVTVGPTAGYEIDDTNSDVDAFLTLVADGIYTNPFADDVVQLEAAYRQSRT